MQAETSEGYAEFQELFKKGDENKYITIEHQKKFIEDDRKDTSLLVMTASGGAKMSAHHLLYLEMHLMSRRIPEKLVAPKK